MCMKKMYHWTTVSGRNAILASGKIMHTQDAVNGKGIDITDLGPEQQQLHLGDVCFELMLPVTKIVHSSGNFYRFVDHPQSVYRGDDIILDAARYKIHNVNTDPQRKCPPSSWIQKPHKDDEVSTTVGSEGPRSNSEQSDWDQ